MPWLRSGGLFGTVVYSDGQFDDARYNLALVQSAAALGADVLNYAAVRRFETGANGQIVAAVVEDCESGTTLRVTARAFVNATGPFSDSIRQMAVPHIPPRIRVSKGVHLLLPLPVGLHEYALLIPATEDGRVIFAIPWLGRLLVGTTETESGPDEDMRVSSAEAEYLLRHLNRYLARPFEPADIVSAIAGLRPLIQPNGQVRQTRRIARDYEIEIEPRSGLISMLGGKWTVYRAMAEDAVDAVERKLIGRTTQCRTRDHKLFGSSAPGTHLVARFGSQADRVLDLAERDPELMMPLVSGAPHIRAEVVYCAREEMVRTLEDVLKRRTGLQYYDWRLAVEAAPVAGELLARELNWTVARTQAEIQTYVEAVRKRQQEIGLSPSPSPKGCGPSLTNPKPVVAH
jgi:glycerol-3-phosphate dehydrogenase